MSGVAVRTLDVVQAHKFTIHHLRELNRGGFHTDIEQDLIAEVLRVHAAFLKNKEEVRVFLNEGQLRIFREYALTDHDLNSLFLRCGAGSNTFLQLKTVCQIKATSLGVTKYAGMEEIVKDVRKLFNEKDRALEFLLANPEFFNDKQMRRVANAFGAVGVTDQITVADIDQLFRETDCGFFLQCFLEELEEEGFRYNNIASLAVDVSRKQTDFIALQAKVLAYLQLEARNLLLSGMSGNGGSEHEHVTAEQVEFLMEDSGVGSYCLLHLETLVEDKKAFSTLEELSRAVKISHVTFQRDFKGVFWYLTHPSASKGLFNQAHGMKHITQPEMLTLYDKGRVNGNTTNNTHNTHKT